MLVPSLAVCVGVALLVPLSPLLIFGWGPIPALGIAGGGAAVVADHRAHRRACSPGYILSGRSLVRPRLARLRWPLFADILRVGAVGAISTLQTTLTVALTTALVGAAAGPDAVAGYGTGARLEYLLIPLVFGLGAPLVALVGTNIGAGQRQRALRIALTGGALAFCLTEAVGLAAAIWPAGLARPVRRRPAHAGDRRRLSARGRPGLRLLRPRPVPLLRLAGRRPAALAAARPGCCGCVLAVGGGWLALRLTGSLTWVFAALRWRWSPTACTLARRHRLRRLVRQGRPRASSTCRRVGALQSSACENSSASSRNRITANATAPAIFQNDHGRSPWTSPVRPLTTKRNERPTKVKAATQTGSSTCLKVGGVVRDLHPLDQLLVAADVGPDVAGDHLAHERLRRARSPGRPAAGRARQRSRSDSRA